MSRGVYVRGVSVQEGIRPGVSVRGVHVQGGFVLSPSGLGYVAARGGGYSDNLLGRLSG